MLKFRTQELVASLGSLEKGSVVELTIRGQLLDGTSFSGTDRVVVVGVGHVDLLPPAVGNAE